jgi:hypothetical protein
MRSQNEQATEQKLQGLTINRNATEIITAIPLKIESLEGKHVALVYLVAGGCKFDTSGADGGDLEKYEDLNRFGYVTLEPESSKRSVISQDLLCISNVFIRKGVNNGSDTLPLYGSVGYIDIVSGLSNIDNVKLTSDKKYRGEISNLVGKLVANHDKIASGAPRRFYIQRSRPKKGIMRELYLEAAETSPDVASVTSAKDEWDIFKRSVGKTANMEEEKKIVNGWTKDGALEMIGGDTISMKDNKGIEFYGANAGGSDDAFRVENHRKLDPENIIYGNRKFNTFLKAFPSTSMRPISQWVEAIGHLDEYALRAIITIVSLGKTLG